MVEPSAVVVAEKTPDGPRKGEKKKGEKKGEGLRCFEEGFFPGLHLPLTRWMDSGTAQGNCACLPLCRPELNDCIVSTTRKNCSRPSLW
jgi:hypothetical protein